MARSWRRITPLSRLLMTLAALAALTACGTHGAAPQLTQPAHVTLSWETNGGSGSASSAGTATLKPFYATHFVVYRGADVIDFKDPATPLQLRNGDCRGPVIAPLTDNAPAPSGTQSPLVWPDSNGGVDVATTPSDQLWLALLSAPGASTVILACGHPLSGDRQYFDLLSVTEQNGQVFLGHTLATALSEPIIASHVDVTLAHTASGPVTWSIRSGSCSGSTVASGQFAANATTGGALFEQPDTSQWWLSVTTGSGSGAKTACGKVSA